MFDKEMAYSLVCLIDENLKIMLKRTAEVKSPKGFTSSEKGMILMDSVCMKRTCLLINTNNNEQTTCEFHRVRKINNERKFIRQLFSSFEILYR
jgi:hypothetical protein